MLYKNGKFIYIDLHNHYKEIKKINSLNFNLLSKEKQKELKAQGYRNNGRVQVLIDSYKLLKKHEALKIQSILHISIIYSDPGDREELRQGLRIENLAKMKTPNVLFPDKSPLYH